MGQSCFAQILSRRYRIGHLEYKSSKVRKEVFLLGREGEAEGGVKEGKLKA